MISHIIKESANLRNQDINKYNKEYTNLKVIYDNTYHDRFIIIDQSEIYHCGSSINHAGTKTFCINKLNEKNIIDTFISQVNKNLRKKS